MVVQPRAAGNEDVDAAVVVVVGLEHVQAADDPGETRFLRPPRETAVAVVVEVLDLIGDAHVRDQQIEGAVVVEVLEDEAAGRAELGEASILGDFGEAADVGAGVERLGSDQPSLRDLGRITAQRHVAEVQEPPVGGHVFRIGRWIGEQLGVELDRLGGTAPHLVDALAAHRQQARLGVVVHRAVLRLAEAEPGEGELGLERFRDRPRHRRPVLVLQALQLGDGFGVRAVEELVARDLAPQVEALHRVALGLETRRQLGDLLLRVIPLVVPGAFALRDGGELRDHVESRLDAPGAQEDGASRESGEQDGGGGGALHRSLSARSEDVSRSRRRASSRSANGCVDSSAIFSSRRACSRSPRRLSSTARW